LADPEAIADGLNPLTISHTARTISFTAIGRFKKIPQLLRSFCLNSFFILPINSSYYNSSNHKTKKITQKMLLGMAILLVIPVVMVFLSLVLEYFMNRWANIIVAIFFFWF